MMHMKVNLYMWHLPMKVHAPTFYSALVTFAESGSSRLCCKNNVCVCVCSFLWWWSCVSASCGLFGWTHRLYLSLLEISLTSATGESGQWFDMPSGAKGVLFPERIDRVCQYWVWQGLQKVNWIGWKLFLAALNCFTLSTEHFQYLHGQSQIIKYLQ